MKGYKVFDKDLKSLDDYEPIQYEIGGEYDAPGMIFQFYRYYDDIFKYHDSSEDIRICEVSALGELDTTLCRIFCTDHIRIDKEVDKKEKIMITFTYCKKLKSLMDTKDNLANGTFVFCYETGRLYIKIHDDLIGITPKKRKIVEFKCKNCGSPMSGSGSIVKCDYCGSVYDVDN